jgi:hypothetical protein
VGFFKDVFSRSDISSQGKDLARQFSKRLPKERVGDVKRVDVEFDILLGNALGFQRKKGLGVFGKSHLVNSLQWSLVEEGYAKDFAMEIGNRLATRLASTE